MHLSICSFKTFGFLYSVLIYIPDLIMPSKGIGDQIMLAGLRLILTMTPRVCAPYALNEIVLILKVSPYVFFKIGQRK